jgi:hypothetical protein
MSKKPGNTHPAASVLGDPNALQGLPGAAGAAAAGAEMFLDRLGALTKMALPIA